MDQQPPSPTPIQPNETVTVPTPSAPPLAAVPPPTTPPQPNKNRHVLSIVALVAVCIGFAVLALWYFQSEIKKTAAQSIKPEPTIMVSPQKIVVGTDPTYPPMEYLEDNIPVGYDVDLANFIGKEMGAQIEFRDITFDELFPWLEDKKIDMIISTITITEERKQKYEFSEPYLQGGQVILTQKTNNTIATTADLKGKKIAVQKGTTIEQEAIKYTPDTMVIRYPDFVQATAALVKGDVDAIFADLPGAKGITNDNLTLKIASDPFTNEQYAIVFRKGDTKVKEVNEALASLKVKGILTDLKKKWLDT